MTRYNSSIAPNVGGSYFAPWAQKYSEMLKNCGGLTQTSDTGQVTMATITSPGNGADAGYEVFRFNDSLQATVPVYMKVLYGIDGTGVVRARWWIGRTTDGAGNITNPYTSSEPVQSGAAVTASILPAYSASDGSGFVMVYQAPGNTSNTIVVVDRLRLSDGTPTADGLLVVIGNGANVISQHVVIWSNTRHGVNARGVGLSYLGVGLGAVHPFAGTTLSLEVANQAPIFPIMYCIPEVRYSRMFAYTSSDAAQGAIIGADGFLGTGNTEYLSHAGYLGSPWRGSTEGSPSLLTYYDA